MQGERAGDTIIDTAPYEAHRRAARAAIQSVAPATVGDDRVASQFREQQRRILARYVCHTRIR
jgi:hypothetical protein